MDEVKRRRTHEKEEASKHCSRAHMHMYGRMCVCFARSQLFPFYCIHCDRNSFSQVCGNTIVAPNHLRMITTIHNKQQ